MKTHAAKAKTGRVLFVPQVTGVLILLIIIIALAAGAVRQEASLLFAGAVFLLPWLYCLIATLLLALIHSRRTRRAFIKISPGEIAAGESLQASYCENDTAYTGSIFELPGILVRCRLLLAAKDGRKIAHDLNPAEKNDSRLLTAEKRGAYFSGYDEFAVFDTLGFFRLTFRLPTGNGARLLVGPHAEEQPPVVHARSGDSDLKPEFSVKKTDDFIDHRPYVPGDDPRRINWKLYGHGGGLLVRDSEFEPPPHSNILILVDAEFDPELYKLSDAREGVDLLCENALATALDCKESGMDVLVGVRNPAPPAEDAAIRETRFPSAKHGFQIDLAWPFAASMAQEGNNAILPLAQDDRGIIIFALPRSRTDTALDQFLKKMEGNAEGKNKPRQINIFFLGGSSQKSHPSDAQLAAAETCIAMYNRRPGIKAGILGAESA